MITITDGELTVEFDGTDFSITSWIPSVAKRLPDGGYEDVQEQIVFNINGSVLSNLRKLSELMDRARAFALGQSSRPVTISWEAVASGTLWVALIVGLPINRDPITLPSNFTLTPVMEFVNNAVLTFERRGQWLTPGQTNLISNGGFEDWTLGEPDDWTVNVTNVGAAVDEETTTVLSGSSSAYLRSFQDKTDYISQDITVIIGSTYRVSGWLYINEFNRATILAESGSADIALSTKTFGQWEYLSGEIVAGDTTLTIYLHGKIYPTAGISSFYADDISVYLVDESGEAGDVATDTAVDNGDVATLAFSTGAEPYPSPTKISITDFLYGTNHPRSFLIVSNGANNITEINAGGLTMVTTFTQVSDSAAFAKSTTIMRYTPTDTTTKSISFISYSSALSGIKRLAVFASVRNNSTTTAFTMYGKSYTPSGEVLTRPILIPGQATAAPYWVYLGELPLDRLSNFFVSVSASAASGTLDIDEFVVVNLDDGLTSVIAIDPGTNTGSSSSAIVVANHGALGLQTPRVELEVGDEIDGWSARGQIDVYTSAGTIEAILLATGGDTSVNRWRQVASAAVVANDWTASRLPGRLTPE